MSHVRCPVTLGNIIEHCLAAIIIEVYIDIGQRYTVGVEEAFEKQVILQRVNLRDT